MGNNLPRVGTLGLGSYIDEIATDHSQGPFQTTGNPLDLGISGDGYFAIDVKTRKEKWRLILRPLDDNEEVYDPCHIDEIAGVVKIVEIREVSAHYE